MTYIAITHEAKGLLYHRYPENQLDPAKRPPFDAAREELPPKCFEQSPNCDKQWAIAKETNSEIKRLAPIINGAESGDTMFIEEMPLATPLDSDPEMILAEVEKKIGPIQPIPKSQLRDSVGRLLDRLALDDSWFPRSLPTAERQNEQAGEYGYAIHCLGRTDVTVNSEIRPKQIADKNYIIAVNGTRAPIIATFKCMWVPGFHRMLPATEVEGHHVTVMFEWEWERKWGLFIPHRRTIPLITSNDGSSAGFGNFVFFIDLFYPLERHVYEVQSSELDSAFTQLQGPLLERLPTLRRF
ncbi:MAG: hypothetical protein JW941_04095 [Candidatus Coatesbacteria bacterium]|nr:hypothetical protein [Candidatus Coatesbacteria bacterium]